MFIRLGNFVAFAFALLIFGNSAQAEQLAVMKESADKSQILLMNTKNFQVEPVDSEFAWNIYPELSRDGQTLAFVGGHNQEKMDIYTLDLKSKKLVKQTAKSGFVLHPSFSGDGKKLAFSQSGIVSDKNQIVIVDLEKGTRSGLSNLDSNLFFPSLNSDGSLMAYQRSRSTTEREIVLKEVGSDKSETLTLPSKNCMAPTFSFDDQMIAFTCNVNSFWNIYVWNRLTKEITQVTWSETRSFAPTFDRFGNIYFAQEEDGKFSIYRGIKNRKNWLINFYWGTDTSLYSPSVSGDTEFTQSLLPNVPAPARSSFGSLELNGKLYVVGGHQGREHTYPPESFLDRVDILDIKTGIWSEGAPRPVAAHGYDLEECDGNIYAFGGFAFSADHKPRWKSLGQVDRYNPNTNTWTTVGQMPRKRSSNVAAKVGDKVYILGGWDSTPKSDNDAEGEFHRAVDVFDCKTETFVESKIELPDPLRRAFTGVVRDGKILLIGGLGVGATHFELLDAVTEFDPATETFKELPKLPFPTFAPAAGWMNGSLFVFGGMFKTGAYDFEYVNHIYQLNEERHMNDGLMARNWSHTGRHLNESKGFAMVVPFEDSLIVAGGHSYKDGEDSPVPTVEVFK
jgi:Tol biopolymer transport system component